MEHQINSLNRLEIGQALFIASILFKGLNKMTENILSAANEAKMTNGNANTDDCRVDP
jgi:hypothetical protein